MGFNYNKTFFGMMFTLMNCSVVIEENPRKRIFWLL